MLETWQVLLQEKYLEYLDSAICVWDLMSTHVCVGFSLGLHFLF